MGASVEEGVLYISKVRTYILPMSKNTQETGKMIQKGGWFTFGISRNAKSETRKWKGGCVVSILTFLFTNIMNGCQDYIYHIYLVLSGTLPAS